MKQKKYSIFHTIRNYNLPDNYSAILKDRLLLMLYIAGIYMLYSLLHIGCPLRFISGIPCPGCGMTRAYHSLLHLDFNQAFYYHPLFPLVPLMVALYLFDFFLNPKLLRLLWAIVLILFIATYLFRLFISHSSVVEIDITSGIMIKLYQLIFSGR